MRRRCGLVVELEDVSRVRIGISPRPLAVIIETARVGERLLAARAAMVASAFQVALPGRVDAVRENGTDTPMRARRLGQLVEPERLVDVDTMSYIDQVVAVPFAGGSPGFVSASLKDEVRKVRHERDVPGSVLENPEGGCNTLHTKLLKILCACCTGPAVGPFFLVFPASNH